MIRNRAIVLAVGLVLVTAAAAHASIRVNGNQLLEGCDVTTISFKQGVSTAATAAPARLIFQLGQGIVADGQLPDPNAAGDSNVAFRIGIGLSWDIATVVYNAFCPVQTTGDMNLDNQVTINDVILLVNFAFKGGPFPLPCEAVGDVNCSGNVGATDVVYLIDYLFRGGPAPCDVCNLIPDVWQCP